MKRIFLLNAASFALVASFSAPTLAQQQGASSGAAPGTPAPTQQQQQARRLLDARRYLNGGDYAGALSAFDMAVRAHRDSGDIANGAQNPPEHAGVGAVDAFQGYGNDTGLLAVAYLGALAPIYDEARRAGGLLDGQRPAGPSAPPGSRPVSGVEDAHIAALGSTLAAANQRVSLARSALAYASTMNDQSYVSEAQDVFIQAQQSATRIRNAIALGEQYRGRAFSSDAEALRYMDTIQSSLGEVRSDQMIDGNPDTSYLRLRDLVDHMQPANPLGLPIPNTPYSLLRHDLEILTVGERAYNEAGNGMSYALSPEGRAEMRRTYGDHVDLVPSQQQRRTWFPVAGEMIAGSIDELPAGSRANARNAGSTSAASSTTTQAGGTRPPTGNPGTNAARVAEERPRPVPTSPDYPTHIRTQAERDAYDRQRAAAGAQADAERQAALQREYEAESARQAEIARREAARLENERFRIRQAADRLAAQNANWNAMVRDRFGQAVWDAFEANGGNLTTLELEAIYAGYNPLNTIPPAQSLSSAPTSLSAAGHSLSAAGTPVRSGTDDYNDPAVQSLYEVLYGLTSRRRGPLGPTEEEVQTANMGDYDLYSDPTGRWGRESGGYLAANLFDHELDYLQRSIVNGRGGLSALLAQPFNVILTWGQGAYDLDLHMTGPTGLGQTDRFHIYYSATGSLTSFPFASLIRDCICNAGSEVILTTTLLGGGVYRVSVFNFGDQAANSNNLSNFSNATIQIVRGGVATAQGNGTTITGGRTILTTNVPVGQFGNTWVAVELDPRSGRITVPRMIRQSEGSANVR